MNLELVEQDAETGVFRLHSFLTDAPYIEIIDFVMFCIFYVMYAILSVILLLNLLIAMMSSTYTNIIEESELKWCGSPQPCTRPVD